MIVLKFFKIIVLFPFLVDIFLTICQVSLKKRGFLLTPLYFITMLILLYVPFDKIIATLLLLFFLIFFFIEIFKIVKHKYRKIYPQYVIRTAMVKFHDIFFKLYILLVLLGSIIYAF